MSVEDAPDRIEGSYFVKSGVDTNFFTGLNASVKTSEQSQIRSDAAHNATKTGTDFLYFYVLVSFPHYHGH